MRLLIAQESKLYAIKWWCYPMCIAMKNLYTMIIQVAVWLQVCCTVSGQNCPIKGKPCSIIHRLEATQFSQNHVLLHRLSGIYLLQATITLHKGNTNIQEAMYS